MHSAASPRLFVKANANRRRQIISLTPLIDVVFILLVFFMLASSFFDWKAVSLSTPTLGTSASNNEPPIVIDLSGTGLRISGSPLEQTQLAARIADDRAKSPERPIVIRPATGVPVQDVVDLLDLLASANVDGVSLVRAAP